VRGFVAGGCMLLALACDGGDWIVGSELPPEHAPSGESLERPALIDDRESCPSAAQVLAQRERQHGVPSVLAEHVGRWRGSLGGDAAAGFPSAELELELDASGVGALTFDVPSAASVELDPGVGYLCDAAAGGVVCGTTSGFVGNFAYPLVGARSRGGVLSFVLVGAAPWDGWCALQPSLGWPDESPACGFSFGVRLPAEPRWSSGGCSRTSAAGVEPIDCALMYALERCECARDACFAADHGGMDVGLALGVDGAVLSGSLWYESESDAASLTLRRLLED
jgi:hypothetical protein